jgi:hypothetical protein
MYARNEFARACHEWISQGGDPMPLVELDTWGKEIEIKRAPVFVVTKFRRYYPFNANAYNDKWLKGKILYWMECMHRANCLPVFDTFDPLSFKPPAEPVYLGKHVYRKRVRKLTFNKANAVFFILRKMGIKEKKDLTKMGYAVVARKIITAFNSDTVLREGCQGPIMLGSVNRLVQQNVKGYKAFNPPGRPDEFFIRFNEMYMEKKRGN